MMNLSKNVKITQISGVADGAAAATDLTSDIIDMSGFEGVMFIIPFGPIVAGAVTAIRAQQGAASNMSDAADLEGTGQTIADTDDEKTFVIDIRNPEERYLRVVVDRATQNATVGAIIAIQYGAAKTPTTAGTDVTIETHASPAEGTA